MTFSRVRRSPVAGLAALLATVTSLLSLSAPPATAAPAPPPIHLKIDKAVLDGEAKPAERSECNALLNGGLFGGVSARDTLGTATTGFREDPPDDLPEDATASAPLFGSKPQVELSDFAIDPGRS